MPVKKATKRTVYLNDTDRARITLLIDRGHALNGAEAIRYALKKATEGTR